MTVTYNPNLDYRRTRPRRRSMCFPWGRNTSVTGSLCSLQSVEMDFRSGNFPPGLLNPSVVGSAAGEAATWCKWLFNTECPTWERFLFNLFFTGHGVWLLLPLSFTILILYRLVGPPEVITVAFEATNRDLSFAFELSLPGGFLELEELYRGSSYVQSCSVQRSDW